MTKDYTIDLAKELARREQRPVYVYQAPEGWTYSMTQKYAPIGADIFMVVA